MESILNTILFFLHYLWANSRGQLLILIISTVLYLFKYDSYYQKFFLFNLFAFNFIQIFILNGRVKSKESNNFLNFFNVTEIKIFISRFIFLYGIFFVHSLLYFISSRFSLEHYLLLNISVLNVVLLKLIFWKANKSFLFVLISFFCIQITILFLCKINFLQMFNSILLALLLSLNIFKSKRVIAI